MRLAEVCGSAAAQLVGADLHRFLSQVGEGQRLGRTRGIFAVFAAYGDLATGLLALLALLTARKRGLFWFFVVAFNVVGATDILVDYFHAIRLGLPLVAGQLGAAYLIPILYVPMLMITHAVSIYWLGRLQKDAAQVDVRGIQRA